MNRTIRRYTKSSKAAYHAVVAAKADKEFLTQCKLSYKDEVYDLAWVDYYIQTRSKSIRDMIAKYAIIISGTFSNNDRFQLPPTWLIMKNWSLAARSVLCGKIDDLSVSYWDSFDEMYDIIPLVTNYFIDEDGHVVLIPNPEEAKLYRASFLASNKIIAPVR